MGASKSRARALYIPHGGGPLPLLGDPGHAELVEFLSGLGREIGHPSAVLVVSAHWEEPEARVISAPNPGLLYDYYGFPDEAYRIRYPVSGAPSLGRRVLEALGAEGTFARSEGSRGFDHGVFVPLALMYPDADIPCAQVSLIRGLDPGVHLRLGRALSALADEDILLLGSGFSFHNMREFFAADAGTPDPRNEAFQSWLLATCADSVLSETERLRRLEGWETAPHARYCHPREEHLLPLHVCAGFAGVGASKSWQLEVLGKKAVALLWEPAGPSVPGDGGPA